MDRELDPTPDQAGCAATSLQLAEFCAGELTPQEAAPVRDHLATCAACRAEMAREQALRETLAGLPLVRCPDHLTRRLLEQTGAAPHQRSARGFDLFHRWTTLAGAVAAAAALVLLLWGSPRPAGHDPVQVAAPDTTAHPEWTDAEIDAARQDLKAGLLLTARLLDRTERSTVKEVLGRTLPRTVNRSLKTLISPPEGGQG